MDSYEHKLSEFIRENRIEAEHLQFQSSCHSVEDAAQAANVSIEDIVKNICLITQAGKLIVAIVKGEDRVSTKRVAKALDGSEVRIATPEEMLEKTGYPCGGIPSFGFPATFLIDPKVMEKEIVYTGGGSEASLVKISTEELKRADQGKVIRIRK